MDHEPTIPDGPAGDSAPPGIAGKAAPPTSRAVAMFVIVFVFFGLLAAAAWFIGGGAETPCETDGRLGPNGETYVRDPDRWCQFVDGDGTVLPDQ